MAMGGPGWSSAARSRWVSSATFDGPHSAMTTSMKAAAAIDVPTVLLVAGDAGAMQAGAFAMQRRDRSSSSTPRICQTIYTGRERAKRSRSIRRWRPLPPPPAPHPSASPAPKSPPSRASILFPTRTAYKTSSRKRYTRMRRFSLSTTSHSASHSKRHSSRRPRMSRLSRRPPRRPYAPSAPR